MRKYWRVEYPDHHEAKIYPFTGNIRMNLSCFSYQPLQTSIHLVTSDGGEATCLETLSYTNSSNLSLYVLRAESSNLAGLLEWDNVKYPFQCLMHSRNWPSPDSHIAMKLKEGTKPRGEMSGSGELLVTFHRAEWSWNQRGHGTLPRLPRAGISLAGNISQKKGKWAAEWRGKKQ